MFVLINKNIKVIVQGFIGQQGIFYVIQMIEYGIQVVGGVIFGKGGIIYIDLLVFNIVVDVVQSIGVNVLVIYVLLLYVVDVILEVVVVGIKVIVCIIEGILVLDMLCVKNVLICLYLDIVLIGLNCFGVIILGECKIGIMLGYIYKLGKIGIVLCLGILIYEVVKQIIEVGLGQFICIGIGGDLINGLNFVDCFKLFNEDLQIEGIIMVGEIGGDVEEVGVEYIKNYVKKLVVGFIVGVLVLVGKCMGYVGVIVLGGKGIVEGKFVVMEVVGVVIVCLLGDLGVVIVKLVK